MIPHTRIALIGCGAVVKQFYLPAIKAIPHLEVTALVDTHLDSIDILQKHFPAAQGLAQCQSVHSDMADLAIVATPAYLHCAQTCTLLKNNVHVLCEKPLALTTQDAQAMIQCANQNQRVLGVGHFRRFFPAANLIKQCINSKMFGRVLKVEFFEGHRFSWPVHSAALFENNGGILYDLGPHILDLLLDWFGYPIDVKCQDNAMGGVDTHVAIQLQFKNNIEGLVQISWDTDLSNLCTIECEYAYVRWPINNPSHYTVELKNSHYCMDTAIRPNFSEYTHQHAYGKIMDGAQCFIQQLLNVINTIHRKASLLVKPEEALLSVQLIEECKKKSTLIQQPWLHDEECSFLSKTRPIISL